MEALFDGEVGLDSLLCLCNYSDSHGKFYSQLREYLCPMRSNPMVPLLVSKAMSTTHLEDLFDEAERKDTPEATAHLLYAILLAQVEPTFHKINVHAAMTPAEVKVQFEPVISQANGLKETYKKMIRRLKTSKQKIRIEVADEVQREEYASVSRLTLSSSPNSSLSTSLNSFSSLSITSASSTDADHDQNKVPFITVRFIMRALHACDSCESTCRSSWMR